MSNASYFEKQEAVVNQKFMNADGTAPINPSWTRYIFPTIFVAATIGIVYKMYKENKK